jgi:hypothetical protein
MNEDKEIIDLLKQILEQMKKANSTLNSIESNTTGMA